MKNIYIAGILLSIALFGCNDSQKKTSKESKETTKQQAPSKSPSQSGDMTSDQKIVYVNSDSILLQYEYYTKVTEDLKQKALGYDQQIQQKAKSFENQLVAFQKAAQTMDINTAKAKEQQLMAQKEQLYKFDENLKRQLAKEEQDLHLEISDKIQAFMKSHAKENGYKMILGYKQGLTMWYAEEGLDITAEVIKGLNEEYNKPKN